MLRLNCFFAKYVSKQQEIVNFFSWENQIIKSEFNIQMWEVL